MTYRERAEQALGHPLPPSAVVHHHTYDGDRSQLVICQDRAYHALLHQRMRARGLKPKGESPLPSYILRETDPDLWQAVKAQAALEDLSIRALIERLLREWVGTYAKGKRS